MSIPPFGSPPTPNASTTTKGKVKLAGDLTGTADLPTVKTDVALSGNPTTTTQSGGDSTTKIATTAFVSSAIAASAAGFQNKGASRLATAAALPANLYNNGASGVGATLTGVSVGALSVDGTATALNDIIIVKDEVAQANNGLYKVTTLGTALVVYVLTRVTNMDQATEISQAYSFVTAGSTNINTAWNVNAGTFVVGTTAIIWNQFNASPSFTAGNGLDLTGSTFSVNVDATSIAISADTLQRAALTGDIAASAGSAVTTLATVNSNTGTFGSATQVPVPTVNAKGLITAISNVTITTGASEDFAYFMGNY